ncbi:MAG: restriction endonuclease, partial [Rhodomicrobium sp.]
MPDLPSASQLHNLLVQLIPYLVGAGVLALFGYLLWGAWRDAQLAERERERQQREYQQALLDFRWDEDMSPIEFEQCCANYLGLKGWEARTTKGSGDQGADVVARKATHVLVVQCKKWVRPIGNKAVQEVWAAKAHLGATAAAVVSNQTFTPAAWELAESTGVFLLHFTELRNLDRLLGIPELAQDDAETVRWYRKAAGAGDAGAMYNLGSMYQEGRGVAQDDAEAVRWYRKAADAGDADAMVNLGFRYQEGCGVAQDDAEAVRWYR